VGRAVDAHAARRVRASAALGTAAGLKVLMRKGKLKNEKINVIAFCGDGGGADMGIGAISATLTHRTTTASCSCTTTSRTRTPTFQLS